MLKKNPALRAGFDLLKKNPRIAKKKLIFDEFSCCFERISKIFGASRRLLKKLLKKNPALRAGSYLLKNNLCLLKINLEKQLFFSKYRLFFSKILLKKNTAGTVSYNYQNRLSTFLIGGSTKHPTGNVTMCVSWILVNILKSKW